MRPTRVAILHGSGHTERQVHAELEGRFRSIGANVFSSSEMTQAGMYDLITSRAYDVVGLIGEPREFDIPLRGGSWSIAKTTSTVSSVARGAAADEASGNSIILAFAPNSHFQDARAYLKIADAVVLCNVPEGNWVVKVSEVAYRFFESLVVPSMLNIDLADVKHIARGIGLALSLSDDNHRKIIERLPKTCLVARSALLHFSCDPDVRLREVYAISKAIALKKGISSSGGDPQINTHADAKKIIRKVNVKMGIRMISEPTTGNGVSSITSVESSEMGNQSEKESKRICLTAIFFGL